MNLHAADSRRARAAARSRFCPVLVLAAASAPAPAQQEAVVEQLAPVLAAEDARNFQPARSSERAGGARLRGAAARRDGRRPDRRSAGHAARGSAALRPRFHRARRRGLRAGPHCGTRPAPSRSWIASPARRRSTAPPRRRRSPRSPRSAAPRSAPSSTASSAAASSPAVEDRRPLVSQIVLESWRLGPDAPVVSLLPFLEDTAAGFRWRAAYTLGRLRAPRGGQPSHRRACAIRRPSCARWRPARSPAATPTPRASRPRPSRELLARAAVRRERAGEDQRAPLAGRLRGLLARVRDRAAARRPHAERPGRRRR